MLGLGAVVLYSNKALPTCNPPSFTDAQTALISTGSKELKEFNV
jgi:hypothetical protein